MLVFPMLSNSSIRSSTIREQLPPWPSIAELNTELKMMLGSGQAQDQEKM